MHTSIFYSYVLILYFILRIELNSNNSLLDIVNIKYVNHYSIVYIYKLILLQSRPTAISVIDELALIVRLQPLVPHLFHISSKIYTSGIHLDEAFIIFYYVITYFKVDFQITLVKLKTFWSGMRAPYVTNLI